VTRARSAPPSPDTTSTAASKRRRAISNASATTDVSGTRTAAEPVRVIASKVPVSACGTWLRTKAKAARSIGPDSPAMTSSLILIDKTMTTSAQRMARRRRCSGIDQPGCTWRTYRPNATKSPAMIRLSSTTSFSTMSVMCACIGQAKVRARMAWIRTAGALRPGSSM